jgi:hypothetical protein
MRCDAPLHGDSGTRILAAVMLLPINPLVRRLYLDLARFLGATGR